MVVLEYIISETSRVACANTPYTTNSPSRHRPVRTNHCSAVCAHPAPNLTPDLIESKAAAAMGGDHGGGHAGGDFRQKVWSMTGGPYCRPVHWRRNTAIAMFGVFLVCIPIAMKSAELEVYMRIPITLTLILQATSPWRTWS